MAGPLDKYISEVKQFKHALTAENIKDLLEILPGANVPAESFDSELSNLRTVLTKQMAMFNRMSILAVASNDPVEIQKFMAGTQQLMALLMKYEDKANAQSVAKHIENAMVESINELGNEEIVKRFRQLLAKNLAKRG